MAQQSWILKTEPSTYSIHDLKKDGKTHWNGVRNFQARNFLSQMKVGDRAFIYHSGDDRSIVGTAEVIKAGYPDPDPKKKGDWLQVDLKFVSEFKEPVTLTALKAHKVLKQLQLVRQSRLSVSPVTEEEIKALKEMF